MSTRYPHALGVRCDAQGCGVTFDGDFFVNEADQPEDRLRYVLDHVESIGWQVLTDERGIATTAETYCPTHAD